MRQFLLAGVTLALFATSVSAGPIRERFAARRGASTCTSCSTATAPAAAKPVATPVAVASPVSNCPGGKCEAPSSRRGIFGLRK